MANLQYIGARYVPKFFENPDDHSNDWKEGIYYEALTIVTYNNDSYTSKKTVPPTVGDPLTNTDYWVCTTKYTAAIMALQTSVGEINALLGSGNLDTEADNIIDGINELVAKDNVEYNAIDVLYASRLSKFYEASKALTDIDIDPSLLYSMQGGAVNTEDGTVLIAFVKEGESVCKLRLLRDDFSLLNSATAELGHANDMTYNPNTNRFYVASGDTSDNVYVLDASTLSIVDTIHIPVGHISQISYDRDHDIFYMTIGGSSADLKIYTCKSNFTVYQHITDVPVIPEYDNIRSLKVQGSCMISGCYVPLLWGYGANDAINSFSRLWFLDTVSKKFVYHYDVKSQSLGDEAEFIYGHDGYYSIIGYSERYITRCDIYTDGAVANDMICITKKFITSKNTFPTNAYGTCILRDTVSPTGSEIEVSFICYGTNDRKTVRISYDGKDYISLLENGSWTDWLSDRGMIFDVADTNAVMGAHNMLQLSLDEIQAINNAGTWNDNVYSFRNVSFTVNDDMTITVSGTASDPYPYFYVKQYTSGNKCPFIGKTVILNGCPEGGSNATYKLRFNKMDGTNEYSDYGNGTQAVTVEDGTQTAGAQQIYMTIYNLSVPITFKPQIRMSTDLSTKYAQFAMTNYELTKAVESLMQLLP